MTLSDGWFGKLLVEKGVLDMLLEYVDESVCRMHDMVSSKLLVLFNLALVKENAYVLARVAELVPVRGIGAFEPFKSIVEWVEKRKEMDELPRESDREKRIREQMDEEAYFDAEDEEEMQVEEKTEEPKEETFVREEAEVSVQEEASAEEEGDSLQSFFKTNKPVQSNPSMKMSLKLNLEPSTFDCDNKRPKLSSHVC